MPSRFALLAFLFVLLPEGTQAQTAAPAYARVERHISASSTAAQDDFDDGLTLLYAFNPEAARRSFQHAAQADPGCAMAWWGIAMSYGININTAYSPANQDAGRAAAAHAQSLAAGASPVERALIAAASKRFAYDRERDIDRSARAYRDAMNEVAATFPLDDDVQTLAAEAEMDVHPWDYFDAGGAATPGTQDAIARLQTVLLRNPGHIGANHLAIHAFEESPHPENAVASADRLASLSFEPAAEHLAHMPAHIYMRVGNYHAAGESNATAIALYETYLASDPPGHMDYIGHDCKFGVQAFMFSGESARATELATTCAQHGMKLTALVDFRFGKWDALENDAPTGDFLNAMLAVHDGLFAAARQHLDALKRTGGSIAAIESGLVAAALARANGDGSAEIVALTDAVAAQDRLGYSEPPQFFFPVREQLGAAYFRSGDYGHAERTFRDDLERNRENPRSLYGLRETLLREGRAADAAEADIRFVRAWREADVKLSMNAL